MTRMELTIAAMLVAAFVATRPATDARVEAAARQDDTRSVWDGVYSVAQAKRGEALYHDTCATCHAADLTGGESAPPLAGPQFQANWNGLTLADLADRMRVSMPPEHPGTLNRQQYTDVLAHVLKVNQFPSGETDLARELEILRMIKFESTKPEKD